MEKQNSSIKEKKFEQRAEKWPFPSITSHLPTALMLSYYGYDYEVERLMPLIRLSAKTYYF